MFMYFLFNKNFFKKIKMYLSEALQIWFCFFHKFLKTKYKKHSGNMNLKNFIIVKVEHIIIFNGVYAARILQYPQKFASILRFADNLIHNRKEWNKKILSLDKKTLILFNHFLENFPKTFYKSFSNLEPDLLGRLVFIQGIVVKEGCILIKKYKRAFIKNEKQNNCAQFNWLVQKDNFNGGKVSSKFGSEYSKIETQDIKLITNFSHFYFKRNSDAILVDISLLGRMTTFSKIGRYMSIWGIVKKKSENFSKFRKILTVNLSIEAVSVFFEKKNYFYLKKNRKPIMPFLDFISLIQDTKIKGDEINFLKKLISSFLSKKFSGILKTVILFTFLGDFPKKNLLDLNNGSINIGFVKNCFNSQYNIFKEIRKFFKNSIYILTNFAFDSTIFIEKQKITSSSQKKPLLENLLYYPLIFFIDQLEFDVNKKCDLVYSLIGQKLLKIFYKENQLKITKPLSIFTVLKLPPIHSNSTDSKKHSIVNIEKLVSLFDVIIQPQDHISNSSEFFIPFFSPFQNKNREDFILQLDKFLKKNKTRSFSIPNISSYLNFLRWTIPPIFSRGAEKSLILWYISDLFVDSYPNSGILFLEKLIKFSQASAKLYNRDTIIIQDTIFAISVLENFLNQINIFDTTNSSNFFTKSKSILVSNFGKILNKNKLFRILQRSNKINTCNSNVCF